MATQNDIAGARRDGELFGIPLGDLGWFQSLLMGVATGMAAFFLATFVAIVGMLIYQTATQKVPPYNMAYRAIGFPVGIVVMAMALGFLGLQWTKRMVRKNRRS
jgi:ABC-type dipeptide/oligopeptide/nickel transport system permease subunit